MNSILSVQEKGVVRLHVVASWIVYPIGVCLSLVRGIGAALFFAGPFFWGLFSRRRRAQEYAQQARMHERRSELPQAQEYYLFALQQDAKCSEAHLGLCRCYLAQLNLVEARVHGEAFLRACPLHAEGNLYMAAVLHYQGHSGAALQLLEKAEKLYPEQYKYKARVLISKIKHKMKV